jgi:hypothetical protein
MYPELEDRPEFGRVQRHRFEIPTRHTTASYIGWLKTDSLVLSLDPKSRAGLLNDIESHRNQVRRLFDPQLRHEVIAAVRNN